MEVEITNNTIVLTGYDEFSPVATFECGQCFRWNRENPGVYTGVAFGTSVRVFEDSEKLKIETPDCDYSLWYDYFDLSTDYSAIRNHVSRGEYLTNAANYGKGIRMLRQDAWEALCSFIISQCNNIPRIKRTISVFCGLYGKEISGGYHAFPQAETVAMLTEDDLAPLKTGYRAKYIISAAKAVASGELNLVELYNSTASDAITALRTIQGVGLKVASCAVLYGLHKKDVVPVDTWIKKALKNELGLDFNWTELEPYAGVAQQYIFYYERNRKGKINEKT